jgi:hypothetical protein
MLLSDAMTATSADTLGSVDLLMGGVLCSIGLFSFYSGLTTAKKK